MTELRAYAFDNSLNKHDLFRTFNPFYMQTSLSYHLHSSRNDLAVIEMESCVILIFEVILGLNLPNEVIFYRIAAHGLFDLSKL